MKENPEISAENYGLRRKIISLSIKDYISRHCPVFLFYDKQGLLVSREYTIEDLAGELNSNVKSIRRWRGAGKIPVRYEDTFIKRGILPKTWRQIK